MSEANAKVDGKTVAFQVEQRPPPGLWLPLSLQHLFAMFGATVLVPLLTGLDAAVALFTSGLGTLVYMVITKGRIPAYLGSSFAFIAPIIAGAQIAGVEGAMFGAFCAGAVYLVVATLIKAFGVKWLLALLPPAVVGPVIIVIGLGLASVAIDLSTQEFMADGTKAYSALRFFVALFTLGCVVAFAIVFKGIFTIMPVLLGVICGYVLAAIVGLVDLGPVGEASFLRVPNFTFFFAKLGDGVPWAMLPLLVPVSVVTIAEHIGDQIVLSRVTGRNFLVKPGLHRSLFGDGVATMLAAFFGGPPNTTYGENIGVLAITRVFSIWVVGGAAVFALLLAFLGNVAAFIGSIPTPVIGGIAIALFGAIAASGLRTLIEGGVDLGEKRNLLIVSIILVIGVGGAVLKIGDWAEISSMALAAIIGMFLHAVLPGRQTAGNTRAILEE